MKNNINSNNSILKILKPIDINQIFPYINPFILYGTFLGINKDLIKMIEENDLDGLSKVKGGEKAIEIYNSIIDLKNTFGQTHLISKAVYNYFPCYSDGDEIVINKHNTRFTFIRQTTNKKICLSNFIDKTNDEIALFAVTVGENLEQLVTKLKDNGDYAKSYLLQSLASSLAEALAEYLHKNIRKEWKIPDPENISLKDIFQAKYVGKRYSFGHKSCPSLENQKILFSLLDVTNSIGVSLTENLMMMPESSVTAIIIKNPKAFYFNAAI